MSDLLPEDAWSNEFQTANPRTLLSALQRRLQSSTTHVHALAELFHERAAIEQEYSARLAKLAKSAETGQLLGKNGAEWERDGGEAKLWKAVLTDVQETSSAHSTLAAMIRTDFEQPIRDIPNKVVAWRRIHDQEAGLDRALKEHDKVTMKLDKAKAKSKKAGDLQAELAQVNEAITSLTPTTFATFQRLDESRFRSLKEVIVRWATARADMAARDGERSEQSAAKILSWEPQEEVAAVGHRLASAAGARPSSQQAATATPPGSNTPTRRMSVQTSGSTDFTPRMMMKTNGSTSNVATAAVTSAGGFSGFKSLLSRKATVGGRQRSGSEATSVRSGRRPTAETFETVDEGRGERQSTPIRERPELLLDHESSRKLGSPAPSQKAPPVDSEGFSIAPADRHRNPWDEPEDAEKLRETTPVPQGRSSVALPSAIMAEQRTASPVARQDSTDSGSASMRDGAPRLNLALSSKPIQESEEERNAALAKMQQTLSLTPQAPARRSTIARGRREARHTVQASSAESGPVPAVHVAALAKMGEEERLAEESSTSLNPGKADMPRRRSVSSLSSRNPFESPSLVTSPVAMGGADETGSAQSGAAVAGAVGGAAATVGAGTAALATRSTSNGNAQLPSPTRSPVDAEAVAGPKQDDPANAFPASRVVASPDQVGPIPSGSGVAGRTPTSPDSARSHVASPISSGRGSGNTTARPGLCATIVETVHVLMHKNQSQSTVITGDVFLSLAPSPTIPLPPAGSAIHIRLTDFDALESIAPNPTFLAQVPDSPGEYYLNTDMIAQASAARPGSQPSNGPLLFQYQVLVEPGSETSIAPVVLNPAFQIKEGETRMILHYRATANSSVSNLSLSVSFPARPKDTQSKPVSGLWSEPVPGSDDHVVTWNPAVQEGQDGKIIARFVGPGRLVPQTISAQFMCLGRLLSGIGIETVDDPQVATGWTFTNIDRSVVSGNYVGEANINP